MFWSKDLKQLSFALNFIEFVGGAYIKPDTVQDFTRDNSGLAAQALLPDSGFRIRTYKPEQIILDQLNNEQKEEVISCQLVLPGKTC